MRQNIALQVYCSLLSRSLRTLYSLSVHKTFKLEMPNVLDGQKYRLIVLAFVGLFARDKFVQCGGLFARLIKSISCDRVYDRIDGFEIIDEKVH